MFRPPIPRGKRRSSLQACRTKAISTDCETFKLCSWQFPLPLCGRVIAEVQGLVIVFLLEKGANWFRVTPVTLLRHHVQERDCVTGYSDWRRAGAAAEFS